MLRETSVDLALLRLTKIHWDRGKSVSSHKVDQTSHVNQVLPQKIVNSHEKIIHG